MLWQTDSRYKKGGYWRCHEKRKAEYRRYDTGPKGQKRSRRSRLVESTRERAVQVQQLEELIQHRHL